MSPATKTGSHRWRLARTMRRGGAAVEMAVVSPLLLMILLGIIEFGYIFMMQQSITNAVREGARVATLSGSTDADIQTRVQESLAPTGLNVTLDMVQITHATTANPVVTVRLVVPYAQVSLLRVLPSSLFAGWFGGGDGGASYDSKMIGSTCSMRVESTS